MANDVYDTPRDRSPSPLTGTSLRRISSHKIAVDGIESRMSRDLTVDSPISAFGGEYLLFTGKFEVCDI